MSVEYPKTQAAFLTLPTWVPQSVQRYVAHTEGGMSIRALARRDGCHASTVLRQIRRLEAKRDDPLLDAALERCCASHLAVSGQVSDAMPNTGDLRREARRVLGRLGESGAVLAVAQGLEKAVVVRDIGGGESARTAVVAQEIVQAMALKDWIAARSEEAGRVARYVISSAGRAALAQMMAEEANQAQGFSEAQCLFEPAQGPVAQDAVGRGRFAAGESPLVALARRRNKDGTPFIAPGLVSAGERLREDFEVAQMGKDNTAEWAHYLESVGTASYDARDGSASEAARQRVVSALDSLGAGLADVALRCCCYLEGLESAEKELGWSARSGKVVLRIALGRLKAYYESTAGGDGDYIG